MQQCLLYKQSSKKYTTYKCATQQKLNSTTKAGYKKIYLLFLLTFLCQLSALSQNALVPIGNWREHLNYTSAQAVVKGNKIYCATSNNVFSVDADNNAERYSKVNGLNDFGVRAIAWDDATKQLAIAYNNSNIDVLKNTTVKNIGDVNRSTITGNKTINTIYCNSGFAYLCSGLGVIVLDLTKYEVKDTWIIGNNGNQVGIHGLVNDGNFWYAATNEGLKKANVNASNLSNYINWQNISGSNGLSNGVVQNIMVANGKLVAHKNDSLLVLNGTTWSLFYTDANWQITNITASENKLLVCQNNAANIGRVLQINSSGVIEKTLLNATYISIPKQAIADAGNVWIADAKEGLSKYTTSFESYIPDGPLGIADGELLVANNTFYAAAGSVNASWQAQQNRNGIYTFKEDVWGNIGYYTKPVFDSVVDIITLAIDPTNQTIWAGSYGGGLVNTDGNTTIIYKQNNASLRPVIGTSTDFRVSGLAFDNAKNKVLSSFDDAASIAFL